MREGMKEKSHRVPEVCEKDVDKTIQRTRPRSVDGYRLYTATELQIRQARGRQVRRRIRQCRRWGGAAQGGRWRARRDGDGSRLLAGSSAVRQGPARRARAGAATRVRARVRLRRLQRCRAAG